MMFVQTKRWQVDKQTRQPGALTSNIAVLCMQAMEYMVNCKYKEAAEKSGHPVECHCVILVSLQKHMNSCALPSLCWQTQAVNIIQHTVSCSTCQNFVWRQCRQQGLLHRHAAGSHHTQCVIYMHYMYITSSCNQVCVQMVYMYTVYDIRSFGTLIICALQLLYDILVGKQLSSGVTI